MLLDETIIVTPTDEGQYFIFDMKRGEKIRGKIISNTRINVHFVDEVNFKKWQKDRTFYAEYSKEAIIKTNVDYEAPKKGTWYLLLENDGRKTATIEVSLY